MQPQGNQRAVSDKAINLTSAETGAALAVRSVSAEVRVSGPLGQILLVVRFVNDLGRTIEGDLVFPLPPMAALRKLMVRLGSRTIEGKVRARERARAEYERAIEAGQSAVLGQSEGEDLTRLKIAPIEAGEEVEVALAIDQMLLPVADGHRLIVPLTYMPRYVEAGSTLTETEAAALARPRPLTLAARASVDIRIEHDPAAAKPPVVRCVSHTTKTSVGPKETLLALRDIALDRDLQVEIADRPKGEKPSIWLRYDPTNGPDGYGPTTAVAVVPPAFAEEGPTIPRTVTFLVDRSGSMEGGPMESAVRAVRGALRSLGPEDRFNVIAFDNVLEALAKAPIPFDDESLAAADLFISGIAARGGTDASIALEAALAPSLHASASVSVSRMAPPDQVHRLRILVFMTDGDVANAAEVLRNAKNALVDTRVHVLGIGDSVQHSMLAVLAELGGGTYMPVSTNEDLEKALVRLKNAITAPLWTGIRVLVEHEGERKTPKMLEPSGPVDLFAAEPSLFAFRGPVLPGDKLILVGQRADGEDERLAVDLVFPDDTRAEGASTLWALKRNQRLSYRFDPEDNATLEGLGVAFGLVNREVALVGVNSDQRQVTISGSVPVVLPLPQNVAASGHGSSGTLAGRGPASAKRARMPAMPAPPPVPRSSVPSGGRPPPPPMGGPPGFGPPPVPASPGFGPPQQGFGPPPPPAFAGPPPVPSSAAMAPPPSPAPAKMTMAGVAPPPMRSMARSEPSAPAKPQMPALTKDEAGLRALMLHQKADGLFDGDLAVTLVAVSALVGLGHTAREGLFRAELRRTASTLKGKLATLSGQDREFALLTLALLTMPHGDDAPEGLSPVLAGALLGISLSDLAEARSKIAVALRALPSGFAKATLANEIHRTFL